MQNERKTRTRKKKVCKLSKTTNFVEATKKKKKKRKKRKGKKHNCGTQEQIHLSVEVRKLGGKGEREGKGGTEEETWRGDVVSVEEEIACGGGKRREREWSLKILVSHFSSLLYSTSVLQNIHLIPQTTLLFTITIPSFPSTNQPAHNPPSIFFPIPPFTRHTHPQAPNALHPPPRTFTSRNYLVDADL